MSRYPDLIRRVLNPPFILFAGIMTPVCILAWNCKPPPVEQLSEEMRARYGFAYEQRTRERNNLALQAIWEARHDPIGRTTLHVDPKAPAGVAAAPSATATAAAPKKQ